MPPPYGRDVTRDVPPVPRDRRAILDQMLADAEELGLYDDPPPDYTAALKAARRRRASEAASTDSTER